MPEQHHQNSLANVAGFPLSQNKAMNDHGACDVKAAMALEATHQLLCHSAACQVHHTWPANCLHNPSTNKMFATVFACRSFAAFPEHGILGSQLQNLLGSV